MIDQVVIKNWKRFELVEFDLRGRHILLVGPNNGGKTSVLQAMSAWWFALNRWRGFYPELNQRNGWQRLPVTIDQFTPVSVRLFDLLFRDRQSRRPIEITFARGNVRVGMEFEADDKSPFQMFVRPTRDTTAESIAALTVPVVFVPAMTGLQVEEPVLSRPKIEQYLGRNRPGEVLRNLVALVADSEDSGAWQRLTDCIRDVFGVELVKPDTTGADIVAEFHATRLGKPGVQPFGSATRFDLASGGAGFCQMLMLLTFLERQKSSLVLLDEPDSHLHVFLQRRANELLRHAAERSGSLVVIATHSEVLLDAAESDDVYVVIDRPVRLVEPAQIKTLREALRWLGNTDVMKARMSKGVLYLEGSTDMELLRAWARVMGHPALTFLEPSPFWRPEKYAQVDEGEGALGEKGVRCQDHFKALRLAIPGYPGLLIKDRDESFARDDRAAQPPVICWRRREIESYLIHPQVLDRYVSKVLGESLPSSPGRAALSAHFREQFAPVFLRNPSGDDAAGHLTEKDLSRALQAAGVFGKVKADYSEIASVMLPSEVHPEIVEKLDAICTTFGLPLSQPPAAGGSP
ncbi:MAG: AAA family ATPase [Planctomycetes bacterium]|jgi:ABC-type hemin transport system ATPase subunit|nr:AAA family ATPase [Planctomycetota bacterium]